VCSTCPLHQHNSEASSEREEQHQLVGPDEAPPKEGGFTEPDRVFAEFVATSAKAAGKPLIQRAVGRFGWSDEAVRRTALGRLALGERARAPAREPGSERGAQKKALAGAGLV
jgi:hypothetical protein